MLLVLSVRIELVISIITYTYIILFITTSNIHICFHIIFFYPFNHSKNAAKKFFGDNGDFLWSKRYLFNEFHKFSKRHFHSTSLLLWFIRSSISANFFPTRSSFDIGINQGQTASAERDATSFLSCFVWNVELENIRSGMI